MAPRRTPALVLVLSFSVLFALPARGDPWLDRGDALAEDELADGDIDEEDFDAREPPVRERQGTSDVEAGSYVSVTGYGETLASGREDVGAMLVVGLPLDRIGAGSVRRIADPVLASPRASFERLAAAAPIGAARLSPQLARQCVAAAWRTSGVGADDARLDALIDRSRASAALPEARLRALRLWNDASRATTLATTDGTNFYASAGANLVLEARLTWRLERLLFAGDEPMLERTRLERAEARARIALRTLGRLFAWARAEGDAREAAEGSAEGADARLRSAEARAMLDVLTGGTFSELQRQR